MYGRRYDRQKPGQPIAARTINRPIDAVEAMQRARYGGGLRQQTGPGGIPLITGVLPTDVDRIVLTPSGGIPAMTGNTPGKAICTFYTFDGTSQVLGTETDWVYNWITVLVPGNRKTAVNYSEGVWWFRVQSCT